MLTKIDKDLLQTLRALHVVNPVYNDEEMFNLWRNQVVDRMEDFNNKENNILPFKEFKLISWYCKTVDFFNVGRKDDK